MPTPQLLPPPCLLGGTKNALDLDHLTVSKPLQALPKDRGPILLKFLISTKINEPQFLGGLGAA